MNRCIIATMEQLVRIIVSLIRILVHTLLIVIQHTVTCYADCITMLMSILLHMHQIGRARQLPAMMVGIQQIAQRMYQHHAAVNKPVNKWLAVNILMINNNINGQRYNSRR